jgi:O-antigen ligase
MERWEKSHNWRSSGFYGHYVTYAEVLQLIMALVFGLIVAFISHDGTKVPGSSKMKIFLILALAGMCLALLLTVTRASQLAFMIAAFCILLVGANRRLVIAAVVVALPIVFGALLFLQQSRGTDFFDARDESTRYRTVMWRDGMRIWTSDAHNFIFGVGMDSIKEHWQEWGMYEGGNLPMGHFHSTPVQLVVERGLPALLLWLAILGAYGRILFRGIIHEKQERLLGKGDPWPTGILLGCMGAVIGFVTSGIVHYNLGDQEVAMVFFLLMGFGVAVAALSAHARAAD